MHLDGVYEWIGLRQPLTLSGTILAILGMISPLSLAQHNLNAPKLFTVALTINTQNSVALGRPFVTILGYSEPIWRPQSKIFIIFGTILPILQSKWV